MNVVILKIVYRVIKKNYINKQKSISSDYADWMPATSKSSITEAEESSNPELKQYLKKGQISKTMRFHILVSKNVKFFLRKSLYSLR